MGASSSHCAAPQRTRTEPYTYEPRASVQDAGQATEVAEPSRKFRPGDVVDIETEDGIELGATVLGPSESLDVSEMRVRFADGVIDDWPIEDLKSARSEEAVPEEPSMSSTASLVLTHSWEERRRRESKRRNYCAMRLYSAILS